MNKNEFLLELRKNLKSLPVLEIETVVNYYNEYFIDAGEENEQKVISELGPPSAVASKIIGEYIVSDSPKNKGFKWVWIVILAVFASPVALPVAFAIAAVLLSLVVAVFAVILAVGAGGAAVAASGLLSIIAGLSFVAADFASALFFLGAGLTGVSVGILTVIGFVKLSGLAASGFKKLFGRLLIRRSHR